MTGLMNIQITNISGGKSELMTKYIAILRGINVGTGRKVPMAGLKKLCENLGLQNVQTYIQSGNMVFELLQYELLLELEILLQQAFTEAFRFDIPVIVRTADEWAKSIVNNPFWNEKDVDIEKLHLSLLKQIPSPELVMEIEGMKFQPDRFEILGNDVFLYCENGYGRTKITNDFFEKKLKIQATTRNWKTVMKLNELSNFK